MAPRRFEALLHADARLEQAIRTAVAFLRAVQQAEFERIHPAPFGQLVDQDFGGKSGIRRAGRAVSGNPGFVEDDLIPVDQDVFNVVAGEQHGRPGTDERAARIGARLVSQIAFARGDAAVSVGPKFDADIRPGRLSGGREVLGAAHRQLDRPMTALQRQQRRNRLQIRADFAAKTAADFGRDNANAGHRQVEDFGNFAPYPECPLCAAPDGQLSGRIKERCRVVRLDIALMDRRGDDFTLNNEGRLAEAALDVALQVLKVVRHIRRHAAFLPHLVRAQLIMQDRRARFHRLAHIGHMRQDFVIDPDETQRLLGNLRAGRADGSDRMTEEERLIARKHILRQIAQVGAAAFAAADDFVGRLRQVGSRYDRPHAGQGFGRAGIDRADERVGVRAAQHLSIEHVRQANIRAVLGTASHLIGRVVAVLPRADDPIGGFGRGRNFSSHGVSLTVLAASSTARTILS